MNKIGIYSHAGATPVPYVPTLIRNENDSQMWANTIGAVFEQGYNLQWKALYPNPIHIKLPNYPFDLKVPVITIIIDTKMLISVINKIINNNLICRFLQICSWMKVILGAMDFLGLVHC